jgi:uncharacterized protein YbjT (DUF2867 family)
MQKQRGVNEMSNPTFLIAGATGATGSAAATLLLDSGKHVRAFVHREDDRSKALRKRGAQFAQSALEAGLEGIVNKHRDAFETTRSS